VDSYDTSLTWNIDTFNNIQSGVNAVTGSTVYVLPGTYTGNVIIASGLSLLGGFVSPTEGNFLLCGTDPARGTSE